MPKRRHLYAYRKLAYAQGERPAVACILCAVRERMPEVESLELYRNHAFLVCVNLYPFNLGHLMLVPLRHIETPEALTEQEVLMLHRLQNRTLRVLRSVYAPTGFNLGYNLGPSGGGSIAHLHLHIVPRFRNELGFMSTVAQTQILPEAPQQMAERLRLAFLQDLVNDPEPSDDSFAF